MAPVSSPRSFGTISNGEIEILLLSNENVEEALAVMDTSFFADEAVCRGSQINLPENVQARKDLLELSRLIAKDGVSVIAKDLKKNKIVGVCFNKLQYLDDSSEESFFEEFNIKKCQSPLAQHLINCMIEWDKQYDIFENFKIDCLLELVFLSTLPECRGKKIGLTLCQYSIAFAKELSKGIGSENLTENLRDKRPKACSSLFTSKISQKVGRAIGMEFLKEIMYSDYSYNGRVMSERIGPENPSCWLCGLKL